MSHRLPGWLFVVAYACGGILIINHASSYALGGGLMLYAAGLIAGLLIASPASGIEAEGRDNKDWLGAEHESPTVEDGDAQKDHPNE